MPSNVLFREAVSDIVPMHHNQAVHDTAKPSSMLIKKDEDEDFIVKDTISDSYEENGSIQSEDILSFCQPGIQLRVFRKLRTGHYPISDELDLHGLTITEAKQVLLEFLQLVEQLNRSCIRIIHGKGRRSNTKGPVLKRKVAYWLSEHGRVLAYHSTLSEDGGAGALYVLLKRHY